ncbi:MAG: hypothetical protein EOM72_07850 [Opitutae bacterium]|nr:hypothetical protein [Opitutae bacterium]
MASPLYLFTREIQNLARPTGDILNPHFAKGQVAENDGLACHNLNTAAWMNCFSNRVFELAEAEPICAAATA